MNKTVSYIIFGLILILLQQIIFNNINLFGYINPLMYILFIIYYPIKNNRILFIFMSFCLGLTVDIFSDTLGLHSASCLVLAYLRPIILKISFGLAYIHQVIKFQNIGFRNRLIYLTLSTITHNFVIFSLEIFSLTNFTYLLQKVLLTALFTVFLGLVFSYLFKPTNK
ncbi:MAG: rod shape-determining protein MreD [Flavobacteriaceae bacterium]|nr:rod shape-determining protein MreD [Flavobacteriaceae bacterium]